jgi:hypothetical protein
MTLRVAVASMGSFLMEIATLTLFFIFQLHSLQGKFPTAFALID